MVIEGPPKPARTLLTTLQTSLRLAREHAETLEGAVTVTHTVEVLHPFVDGKARHICGGPDGLSWVSGWSMASDAFAIRVE